MGGLGGSLSGPRGGSREPRERCDPKQGHPRKRGEANGGRATGRRERTERQGPQMYRKKSQDPAGGEAQPCSRPRENSRGPLSSPGGLTPERHGPAQSSRAPLRRMPATSLPPSLLGISWAPVGPMGHPVTQEGAQGCSASEEQKYPGDSHAALLGGCNKNSRARARARVGLG